ncbi:DUF4198 domain-containing protein [Mucilaginibacter dorajii]|uniref:DUF4198 domain-containing protein n=1 Tax=Mucilaginibacter dorajii TaxID=692994 RepID=A0ABP7R088_9SPHI|nr:DUF4198 domain-containing protein [Mucilaginibacter dorajii]MCS3732215.1 putative GH25 family protein [Mucilaginibacter dorajii]
MKTITLTFLLTLSTSLLFAHSLWIETAAKGKIGQSQSVKLYFGEFAQDERDELSKWRSDLPSLTLWLIAPDGQKTQLETKQGGNVVESAFTPQKDGVYTLLVSHKLKDLSGGTGLLEFSASTNVSVGTTVAPEANLNTNEIKALPVGATKVNSPLKIKVWVKGENKAGGTVLVFSPNKWAQELTTDGDGSVTFTPLWPGKYVVEATNFNNVPGSVGAINYKTFWQGATYSFEVNK